MRKPKEYIRNSSSSLLFHDKDDPGKDTATPRRDIKAITTTIVTIVGPLLPLVALLTGIVIVFTQSGAASIPHSPNLCDPNGKVRADWSTIWNTKYTLAVSLGYGRLSYSVAKVVDIIWDLVVGRGCQALAAIIVYYVFRNALCTPMRHAPARLDTALTMQYDTTSLLALWYYWKNISHGPSQKRKAVGQLFVAVTLAATTIYVLSLPTWLSAMTAYQPIMHQYFSFQDILVPLDQLRTCDYVVYDGDRVGLDSPACILKDDKELLSSVEHYFNRYVDWDIDFNYGNITAWNFSSIYVAPSSTYSSIVPVSSYYASNRVASIYVSPSNHTYHLDPPSLRIDALTEHKYYKGQFYDKEKVAKNGVCAPSEYYHWGFSFLLLLSFVVITFVIWTCVYIVWVYSLFAFDSERTTRTFGSLRTALEVGLTLQDQLGDSARESTNHELKNIMREKTLGIGCFRNEQAPKQQRRRRKPYAGT